MIELGADVNCFDNDYDTPLTCSIINGNIEIIEYLIKKEANVNKDIYSCSAIIGKHTCRTIPYTPPLHFAVMVCSHLFSNGKIFNSEIIELLIKNDAKLNQKDWKAQTPLDITIDFNNNQIKTLLSKYNAEIGEQKQIIHNIIVKKLGIIK